MRGVKLHAMLLALTLMTIGAGATFYQIYVLNIPVSESVTDPVWVIDARVQFRASGNVPVKVQMFVPPGSERYLVLNESFISQNYGVNVNRVGPNRQVTWSVRRAQGDQTLYYRKMLSRRFGGEQTAVETGPQFRARPPLEGVERAAAEALLAPIRQHSADVDTFISETIQRVNNLQDENVGLLLANDTSIDKRARVIETLLAVAHIPVEQVHTLRLMPTPNQTPELWLRSFNGTHWTYFNPATGDQGLPDDRIVWWIGATPVSSIEGGSRPNVTFSVTSSEVSAIQLAQDSQIVRDSAMLSFSLYDMPVATQEVFSVMIMIPLGVLLILLLRNLVGFLTLGTFTPVLVALAFRETEVLWGIVLFTVITTMGLSLRSYLEHLQLQLLSRLSVVLTFVVILMALISLFGHKLGWERGLSVALFPMVILTMVIERLSILWEERGATNAFKAAIGTLVAATLAHLLMTWPPLVYFCFTFPGVLLVMAGIMLLMGHYRGYRLTELLRFRALAGKH
ncbi:inactive transglutaminase family protein [Alcanivorax sp. S71-1-4]|uniref:inactive transglutaminase family protein n=1 Tax=Alcanivorax sp. S71-1-4 TaxID=1177159 RepID=UPI0013590386|nr:inactive transglutaminase family protein [Alcanivorax sp. S71-1-4]